MTTSTQDHLPLTVSSDVPAADRNQEPTPQARHPRWPVVLTLFAYTLAVRMIPYVLSRFGFQLDTDISIYPWNFTPFFAVCLFAGARFKSRAAALLLPVGLTLFGDVLILAITRRPEMVSWPVSLSVCAASMVSVALGFWLRRSPRLSLGILAGAAGAAVFFLVTNFAVWAVYETYPHTPEGLLTCYLAGLPYLRNAVISTAVFGAVLFSPLGMKIDATLPAPRIADPLEA